MKVMLFVQANSFCNTHIRTMNNLSNIYSSCSYSALCTARPERLSDVLPLQEMNVLKVHQEA